MVIDIETPAPPPSFFLFLILAGFVLGAALISDEKEAERVLADLSACEAQLDHIASGAE